MHLRRGVIVIALLLAVVVAGCGDRSTPREAEQLVYRVSVRALDDRLVGERTEWVAPSTGEWRVEQEGGDGETGTLVYSNSRWANVGHYVAIGPTLTHGQADASIALAPLRRHLAAGGEGSGTLRATLLGHALELVIQERLTQAEAKRQGLFTISTADATTVVRELAVGAQPAVPVAAYWLGPSVAQAKPLVATQTRSHGPTFGYSVYYELRSAEGKSSAMPSEVPPAGEIHVTSTPRRGPIVREEIARYRQVEQSRIVLANGESGTFFPFPEAVSEAGFAVATKTTLVRVFGPGVTLLVEEERANLAARLRPL